MAGLYQPLCRPLLLHLDMVWQIERTVLSKEGLHRSSAGMSTLESPALLGLQSYCGAIVHGILVLGAACTYDIKRVLT